jgi:hypothetical protein
MDALVGEWKRSELLREASEAEVTSLREQLRFVLSALHSLRLADLSISRRAKVTAKRGTAPASPAIKPTTLKMDDVEKMRAEMERLRERNRVLEEAALEASV